jgi:hypothetical protein
MASSVVAYGKRITNFFGCFDFRRDRSWRPNIRPNPWTGVAAHVVTTTLTA